MILQRMLWVRVTQLWLRSWNCADIFNIGSLSVSLVSIQAKEEWT